MLLHLFAILSVVISAIGGWLQAFLLLFILMHLWRSIRQWQRQPVYRVQYLYGSWCLLVDGSPVTEPTYKLKRWHFWSVYLLIVEVEDAQGKRCRLPLMMDCCQADEFRWLRVVIKYYL
jgi:hypothetical protein